MLLQRNYVNDALFNGLGEVLFIPARTATVFQGRRVFAISLKVGGQIYVASDGGHGTGLSLVPLWVAVRLQLTQSAADRRRDRIQMIPMLMVAMRSTEEEAKDILVTLIRQKIQLFQFL